MPASPATPGSGRGRDPESVAGSGRVPPTPPIGFPVYGLDASWPGARRLESFGDQVGEPPRWAELAHQGADGESLILVASYSRPRTDQLAAHLAEPPLADVASRAASTLINVTLPGPSVPRPDGCLRALAAHATGLAGQYARWQAVGWRVDGAAVAARAVWFAGGWAAVSDGLADGYLAAVGTGAGPDGLSLARLRDGAAYHFDLDQPLPPEIRTESSQAAFESVRPEAAASARRDWHPDQLRLMGEPGRAGAR